jgi:hypothetical protein
MDSRTVAAVQGVYFLATGIWPLVDIESFMAVTGPKSDLWLVRTVGILVAVVGATLLRSGWKGAPGSDVAFLAVGSAAGLAGIDIVYSVIGVISPVYLLDALLELGLVGAWLTARSRSSIAA